MTDIFTECKERVAAREAALFYGLQLDRAGRALCLFHPDRHPSMSFKGQRFRCWSCGASGTAIDLTAKLFGLPPREAVKRLDADFHLALPIGKPRTAEEHRQARQEAQRRRQLQETWSQFEEWRRGMVRQLNSVFRTAHLALVQIETPRDLDALTAAEVEAIHRQPWAAYTADVLTSGTMAEKMEIFRQRKEVAAICNRILQNSLKRSGAA